MANMRYKQYILLLDPKDQDDVGLIDYLASKHGKKHKNSFSAILRMAITTIKDADDKLAKEGNVEKA